MAANLGTAAAFGKFPSRDKSARSVGHFGARHLTMTLSRRAATLVGFCAVLLWASLAVLTAASGAMPPFQLLSITFGIGGVAGVLLWIFRPRGAQAIREPW